MNRNIPLVLMLDFLVEVVRIDFEKKLIVYEVYLVVEQFHPSDGQNRVLFDGNHFEL
jgi:hypothetical protein